MDFRKMMIEDYDAVYALWLSCKGMGLNNLDDSREGIETFIRRNPDTCFVACREEKVVGCIMAGNDGRRGYIYHVAVCSEERNKGIAAKLVKRAEQAMVELGIHKMALVVFERNDSGNAFWERQGYTVRNDLVYRNKALKEIIRIDT